MQIGAKIRSLRLMHDMTLEDLADRTELSKGYLSQLERDLASPSIATLMDILDALGTDLREFFSSPVNEKVVFTPEDTFEKNDEEAGVLKRFLIPNAQKNLMEPLMITLQPGSFTPVQDPHQGEEFGYVLSGTIYLHEGLKRHRLKKGDSFYFRAAVAHGISNPGKHPAVILWVADPPSF